MTTRRVDDNDTPNDSRVVYLNTVEGPRPNVDAFSRPAAELRKYAGQDNNFRRRVDTTIKKYNRGTDVAGGAKSQKVEPEAEVTGYNIYDVVLPPYNLDYLAKLYEVSAPHYSAVNAKVANIVGLGYKLVETSATKRNFDAQAGNEKKIALARKRLDTHRDEMLDKIDEWNEEDTFTQTLVKFWRDYEVTGNGYLEISRKKDGTVGYVGHIASQTMRIRKQRDGYVQISGKSVVYFANFGDTKATNPLGGGRPNEVIHLAKYSPTNGFYGVPDIIAAKNAVAGNEFAARFNLDYFENKATPRYVVTLKGTKLSAAHEQALLEFFETGLKGQNHRTLFVPLPGHSKENPIEFNMDAIEAGVQDSSFANYRKANLADILMAHRVPITKVSVAESASLATARDADKMFKEQVCAPEQQIFEKKLNRIIKEFTTVLELKLNEMTLTDANTQSQIDERRVKNGIDLPNEIRARDGQPGIPGGEKRVDLNAKNTQGPAGQSAADATANRQRDAQRSAATTDNAGNGRSPKGDGRTNGVG